MTVTFKKKKKVQLGTVIVFYEGLPEESAMHLLKMIKPYLDPSYHVFVSEFDPEHGGPVWYIP